MDELGEPLFRQDLQKYVPVRSEQPYGQSLNSLLPQEAVSAAWEHLEKGQDRCTDLGVGDRSQPACGLPHVLRDVSQAPCLAVGLLFSSGNISQDPWASLLAPFSLPEE